MSEPQWLTEDEQRAWRALAAVMLRLPGGLEQQLQRDAGLSHFEYWVLALLSEAPEWRLRLSELAHQANASLSRLSHVVTRLELREWVQRTPCADDARATMAELTQAGWAVVEASAPGHVERVRELVFNGLDDTDVADLERMCAQIVRNIEDAKRRDR
ncbi:MAG: MarR family transcriptional regulator [Nitriliruptoraceae bacterium]